MYTIYGFARSFGPKAACQPKEKHKIKILTTLINVQQNICYLSIQLLKI